MAIRNLGWFREMTQGPSHRWWALTAVECGNFVVYMDGFIVTLALPAMNRDFGVGLAVLKWVIVAYLCAVTVTLLPAGRLSDIWGRRRIVVIGMVVIVMSAILCAFAPTIQTLIVFRVLQGVGGGLVLANVMAEITAVFPHAERRKAMAVNASVLALAQVTGLILGGLLIGYFGWRSLFFIILAVSVVGLCLSLIVLTPSQPPQNRVHLDWVGALLAVGAVGAPFLFIELLSRHSLHIANLALLAGGVVVTALFVAVEQRTPQPLLDLNLFQSRAFTCGSLSAAFYFIAAVSGYFLLPLYAQTVLRLSPVMAGVLLLPLSVVLTATSLTVSRLGNRFSARTLSTLGMICVSTAVFGLSRLGPHSTFLDMLVPLILLGMGGGLFHPPNNSATLNTVPPESLGVANGFLSTSRNFGQAMGAALAATLLAQGLGALGAGKALSGAGALPLSEPYLFDYIEAQRLAFRLAALMGLIGAAISVLRGSDVSGVTRMGQAAQGQTNQSERGH